MPDVSQGTQWVDAEVLRIAARFGLPDARGTWGPEGEGFTTGKRNLTITVGTKQRRVMLLEKHLEDVSNTPGIQAEIRLQLRYTLLTFR
jgi:hypothetical protein